MQTKNYMQDIIANIQSFGSLPEIPQQILQMSSDPDASLLSIGLLVEKDVALSSQILRKVNSSYYGLSRHITNIKEAVSILGISEICNIAITSSMLGLISDKNDLYYENLFQKSFCTALASDLIGERVGIRNRNDVYLAGLFLYLGQIVFLQSFPDDYIKIIEEAKNNGADVNELEQNYFDITSNRVGEMLCDNWNLPENIKHCVKYRDKLELAIEHGIKDNDFDIIRITTLGSIAANIFFGWNKAGNISRFKGQFKKLNLVFAADAEDILKEIPQILKDAGAVFLLKVDQNLSYESILKNISIPGTNSR